MSLIDRIKQWQASCIPGPWKNVRDTVNGMNAVQDDAGEVIIITDYGCISQRCEALPDMEAALLAAEEMAVDLSICADNIGHAAKTDPRWEGVEEKLRARLAAYREATA